MRILFSSTRGAGHVLEEGSFKAEARRLAAEMAKMPMLDTALDALLACAG